MWKKLLVLGVVLGFAWSYPPTRRPMSNALAPVLSRLGPVGERIGEPTRRYDARNELEFISNQIQMRRDEGRPVPDIRSFQPWLKQNVTTRRQGMDPWGRPYFLARSGNNLMVGSVGQDGERGTADDVTKALAF